MPLLILLLPAALIVYFFTSKPSNKMAEIKTKWDFEQKVFFLGTNGQIATGTVKAIDADEKEGQAPVINNTIELADGSNQVVNDDAIWLTPEEVADAAANIVRTTLLAAWSAANPPATEAQA